MGWLHVVQRICRPPEIPANAPSNKVQLPPPEEDQGTPPPPHLPKRALQLKSSDMGRECSSLALRQARRWWCCLSVPKSTKMPWRPRWLIFGAQARTCFPLHQHIMRWRHNCPMPRLLLCCSNTRCQCSQRATTSHCGNCCGKVHVFWRLVHPHGNRKLDPGSHGSCFHMVSARPFLAVMAGT